MKKYADLTKRDWLLLSAYLDGELSPRKKTQVEELLQTKPASREALDVLRRTCQVLKYAPLRKVPKNFTLTEEMIKKPLLPLFSQVLSYSSAMAGILLVIVFGFDIFSSSMQVNEVDLRAAIEEPQAAILEEEAAAEIQENPAIIEWNEAPAGKGAYGMGGADDRGGLGAGMGGGGEAMDTETEIDPEILFGEGGISTESSETAPPSDELSGPEEIFADESVPSEDGILGIQPEEKRGQIINEQPALTQKEYAEQVFPWRLAEIILAITTLATGLGAIILRRHRR